MSNAQTRKATLRKQFADYRTSLPGGARARHSQAVCERLRAEVSDAEAAVLCYWPSDASGEVDVRPLVEDLHASGHAVALPVVTSFEEGAPAMDAQHYAGRSCLRENRWGLLEPADTEPVAPEALGAVVVPAFGAGRNGHRVGHGSGFYDAFLPGVTARKICPVYDACLVNHVPAETHDVPMDTLVTEAQTVHLSARP